MIASKLIAKVKAHRGPVLVGTSNADDTLYIQAVKSDLVLQLGRYEPDQETGFYLTDDGYVGRDYVAEAGEGW